MKKYFVISLFLGIFSSYAQQKVGIGTDEPTRTLDINGEFRVRDLVKHKNKDGLRYLTADEQGNIGSYEVDVDYVGLDSREVEEADKIKPASGSILRKKLTGMEVKATIPANKHIVLIVSYSLPMGAVLTPKNSPYKENYSAYFGVRLYRKDDTTDKPIPKMTRKFTPTNVTNVWDMISITNQYVEEFKAVNEVRTVTFYLEGFVDNLWSYKKRTIGFNAFMDKAKFYNKIFNWGHAYMTYETLELKANKK